MVLKPVVLKPTDRSAAQNTTSSCVFAAYWCCSVGVSWTVELRPVELGQGDVAALTGPAVEWICSGVPTYLPAPERQTAHLLGERDLLLVPVEAVESAPRARSRRLIGYVTRDPEVIMLARILADAVDERRDHPMVLAARWIQAGYPVGTAASWIATGVTWPEVADTVLPT